MTVPAMSDDEAAGDGHAPAPPTGPDKTTPRVDLALRGLTVSVTGRSEDELDAVEDAAKGLMDYLVETLDELEDEPSEYGLS